jgi:uncharacterized damage-inducible protein DinB
MNAQEQQPLFIKMALMAWDSHITRMNRLLGKLEDAQFEEETAPGRNTGTYLLGHLTAVNDSLHTFLGLGEKLYPELETVFITSPDKSGLDKPSVAELRTYWNNVTNALNDHFGKMTADDWFSRHTAVSEEAFAKEPHRNKLNVLISRTNHQAYHWGQMAFLDKKEAE